MRIRAHHVLLAFVCLFAACEIGLRAFTDRNSAWNIRLGASKRFDPVTQFRLRPLYRLGEGVTTNENGYLAPVHLGHAKPADVLRLVYLGDSVTVLPVPGAYPEQVETSLAGAGLRVETLNAAVPGYSSVNARALFESDLQHYDGDYFFVYLGWNDLGQYCPEGKAFKMKEAGYQLNAVQKALIQVYSLRMLIAAGDFLQQRQPATMRALDAQEAALYDRYQPTHFEDNLRAIVRLAKQRYPVVVVMNLATLTSENPTPDDLSRVHGEKVVRKLHKLVITYNAVVDRIAAQEQVEKIDLYALFGDEAARRELTDSCHVDRAGAARIARAVSDLVLRREGRLAGASGS